MCSPVIEVFLYVIPFAGLIGLIAACLLCICTNQILYGKMLIVILHGRYHIISADSSDSGRTLGFGYLFDNDGLLNRWQPRKRGLRSSLSVIAKENGRMSRSKLFKVFFSSSWPQNCYEIMKSGMALWNRVFSGQKIAIPLFELWDSEIPLFLSSCCIIYSPAG